MKRPAASRPVFSGSGWWIPASDRSRPRWNRPYSLLGRDGMAPVAVALFANIAVSILRPAWLQGAAALPTLIIVLWTGIAPFLVSDPARTRGSEFELVLPRAARDLWTEHINGVLESVVAILAVLSLFVLIPNALSSGARYFIAFGLPAYLFVFSGSALAAVMLHALDLGQARIPLTPRTIIRMASVLFCVPALLVMLARLGAWAALLPLALACLARALILRRIPASFTLSAVTEASNGHGVNVSRPGNSGRREAEVAAPLSIITRVVLGNTIWNGESPVSRWLLTLPGLLWVAAAGFILGGGLAPKVRSLFPWWFIMFPQAALAVFITAGPRIGKLYRLDALPIPRRRIFRTVVFPALFVLSASCVAGFLISIHARVAQAAPPPGCLPFLLAFGLVPALALLGGYYGQYRSCGSDWTRSRYFSLLYFAAFLWPSAVGWAKQRSPVLGQILARISEAPVHWVNGSPVAGILIWPVSAAAIYGAYRFALTRFEQMELPPQASSISWFRSWQGTK